MNDQINPKEKLRLQLSDMIGSLEDHLWITQPGQHTRKLIRQGLLKEIFGGEYQTLRVLGKMTDDEEQIYKENLI